MTVEEAMKIPDVTPLAGVWIEIIDAIGEQILQAVTPLAGVWIEIGLSYGANKQSISSLPSRECGLK